MIKIGVYEPASGDNGAGGKQETLGIQYANSVCPTVEVGGTTYDVELVIVDNESSNDKGPTAAASLVSSGVTIALGSYGSGVSIAASDVFGNAGIPIIGVTCTNLRLPRATSTISASASSTPSRALYWPTLPLKTSRQRPPTPWPSWATTIP